MPSCLMAVAIAVIFLFFPLHSALTATDLPNEDPIIELPTAFDAEAFFDDLPFQQQRQILREEIQQGPQELTPRIPPRQYNLLIR